MEPGCSIQINVITANMKPIRKGKEIADPNGYHILKGHEPQL
jgi:hypothetical protein